MNSDILLQIVEHPTLFQYLVKLLAEEVEQREGTVLFGIECRSGVHRSVAAAYLLARCAQFFGGSHVNVSLETKNRSWCTCAGCQGTSSLLDFETEHTVYAEDMAKEKWELTHAILQELQTYMTGNASSRKPRLLPWPQNGPRG